FAVSQSGLTTFRPYANPLHRRQIFDWKHHALVLISYVKNLRNRRSLLLPLRGFTLAEVLITLGIIGVVAALTIPTLMQSYQNKQYVTGFQKAYQLLNTAFTLSEAHNGFSSTWDIPTSNQDIAYIEKYWLPYFSIAQTCGFQTGKGCFQPMTYLSGNDGGNLDNVNQYKFILSDGMSVNLCPGVTSEKRTHIIVDTNGKKGPNTFGRDIYWFDVFPNDRKIYPFGMNYKTFEELKETCSVSSEDAQAGAYCGAYLVRNGYKMDY
ncbi:type II secretion system protein, partial [bacterium]|nr:type II secretion system protein [bacterium]